MRHPSARGLGIRYLIAVLLPISGVVLVVYTAFQLAVAHATHSVPPPRRIAEAMLTEDYLTGEPGPEAASTPAFPPNFEATPGTASEPAPVHESGPPPEPEPAPTPATR